MALPPDRPHPAPFPGLHVFERGWLSANNILLQGHGEGAVLVDSSHSLHAPQTLALVGAALAGEPLRRVVNTHLHSDHCGGNAALQRAHGCTLAVPPGEYAAARAWDEAVLSYRATGQTCERFHPDHALHPGEVLAVGRRRWQVLAAPGHDPHSVMLFDADDGLLISADALWEHGFGVVFPELDGEAAFDEVGQVLDLIERLAPRAVIPGHGRPFTDVSGALQRARQRLAGFVADPARHARHGARVLVKYHLMEVQRKAIDAFDAWFASARLCSAIWARLGHPEGSLQAFGRRTVEDLVSSGALRLDGAWILDVA